MVRAIGFLGMIFACAAGVQCATASNQETGASLPGGKPLRLTISRKSQGIYTLTLSVENAGMDGVRRVDIGGYWVYPHEGIVSEQDFLERFVLRDGESVDVQSDIVWIDNCAAVTLRLESARCLVEAGNTDCSTHLGIRDEAGLAGIER